MNKFDKYFMSVFFNTIIIVSLYELYEQNKKKRNLK